MTTKNDVRDSRTRQARPGDEIAPTRYCKLPVEIEAIRWSGTNLRAVIDFIGRHPSADSWTWEHFEEVVRTRGLKIFTLEGHHMASVGDYIIKGVHGEAYPCKPDIFWKTYRRAGETVSETKAIERGCGKGMPSCPYYRPASEKTHMDSRLPPIAVADVQSKVYLSKSAMQRLLERFSDKASVEDVLEAIRAGDFVVEQGEESGDVRKSETPQGGVGSQMPREGSIPSALSASACSDTPRTDALLDKLNAEVDSVNDQRRLLELATAHSRAWVLHARQLERDVEDHIRVCVGHEQTILKLRREARSSTEPTTRLLARIGDSLEVLDAIRDALKDGPKDQILELVNGYIDRAKEDLEQWHNSQNRSATK